MIEWQCQGCKGWPSVEELKKVPRNFGYCKTCINRMYPKIQYSFDSSVKGFLPAAQDSGNPRSE